VVKRCSPLEDEDNKLASEEEAAMAKIGDGGELGAAHRRDRGTTLEGAEDMNMRQEKLSEHRMQLQRERKGDRDEPFTGDVCSTDGNGGTEVTAMVNGVAQVARLVKV
jgi:hypothetical protein